MPKIPDGDVLVHAGDWSGGRGSISQMQDLNAWFGTLPHKHKLITAGNHDSPAEHDPAFAENLFTNARLVLDKSAVINGFKFYLSPWTPTFFDWHFMRDRGPDIARKWARIPDDTDVLVTHGPPMGILDQCPQSVGCQDLLDRVRIVKPKLHIFGHIHEGAGQILSEGTRFVNASSCDWRYRPVNAPIVIDL